VQLFPYTGCYTADSCQPCRQVHPAGKSTLIDLVLMSTPQSQLKNWYNIPSGKLRPQWDISSAQMVSQDYPS